MGVAGCSECSHTGTSGPATCTECQAGFVTKDSACVKCGDGCSACSADTPTQCTACVEGKYLKDGNTCVDAGGCDNGNYADKKTWTCKACSEIQGCTACAYDDATGKPKCTDCGSKTVRDELDGTTTCVDEAECKVGKTHFYDASKCVQCGDNGKGGVQNCKLCTAKGTCEACVDGYKVNGNACEACTGNCAECGTAGQINTCTRCMPGYFLKDGPPKTCVLCDDETSGIPGCAECTGGVGSLKCTECKPNYRPSGEPSDLTCTKTCEDETACGGTAGACDAIVVGNDGSMLSYCSKCVGAGYGPINGKCTNALAGNTCADGVCTRCTNNYFLYMGGCYDVSKAPGNLMCSAAPSGFCTTPVGRYFKIPGDSAAQQKRG
ncbi:High cysteine protein [Giardia duodenalis]|uniref:High cysteine protein n=1 Tax=Giardia intestinalis (strain ATCC 50803 / WB clone C6) TaxID=184922 RepID=A0A644F8G0_GIAIC|nr:High cysteine protein [Giardia intestinalis]KAE8304682.1 High cysteine protein [Giardia intestinalis]